MADLAKEYRERHSDIKKKIEDSYNYFTPNRDRFNEFMKFVFKSSLTDNEMATLADRGMPTVQFNILEAIVSRQRGEFAKQQPAITVRAADGVPLSMLTPDFTATIEVVEAHIKSILLDESNDMLEYNVFTDCLAGGYSVIEVYNKYPSPKSFEQVLCVERPYQVTMCGFDPLAVESHKGDGNFCWKMYPMTRSAFEHRFGKEATRKMRFVKSVGSISWSFKNNTEEVVIVCEFYEKKFKKVNYVKLSNGAVVTDKEYDKFVERWLEKGFIEQPPVIVDIKKNVSIESIERYIICESCVLEREMTPYKFLPLVFVGGNSVTIEEQGAFVEMTRPYVYHAMGIQRLKNLAGQSLGNELENTIQHKFTAAIESIPTEYQDAYQNVQKADILLYKHFYDPNSPDIVLPPPREINRTPIPPQITETFRMTDEMTQMILGSYDQNAGISNGAMSGIAFARSAIQSNNAATPYIVGYIKGLERVAQILVDLIPKFYRTPRSIPVQLPDGKREYMEINKKGSIFMDYDPESLQVKVETGVNFAMQKEIALQTIVQLSQTMPSFAQFFSSKGLQTLLDNIEIRGIDSLKEKAVEYEKEQAEAAQMAQQMQQQQAQMQMAEMQKQLEAPTETQLGQMMVEEKAQYDAATIAIKQRDSETRFIEVMSKIQNEQVDNELRAAQIDAENTRSAVEGMVSISSHIHDVMESQNERKMDSESDKPEKQGGASKKTRRKKG